MKIHIFGVVSRHDILINTFTNILNIVLVMFLHPNTISCIILTYMSDMLHCNVFSRIIIYFSTRGK